MCTNDLMPGPIGLGLRTGRRVLPNVTFSIRPYRTADRSRPSFDVSVQYESITRT